MIKARISALVQRLLPSNSNLPKEASLFVHTSGRWLWNESFQQKQHTRVFDVAALKKVIAETVLPSCNPKLVQLSKLAEGASNKVFLATTHEQRLIVKVTDPIVPSRLITASEVATLQYLRDELGLPIPRVLAWNDDETNAVGCEYIVMEEASGQALNQAWPTLSDKEKLIVINDIVSMQARLIEGSHRFNSYGSLYFTQYASNLGLPFDKISSQLESKKYCIGPLASPHMMTAGHKTSGVNRGPWTSGYEYIEALISSSVAQIQQNSDDSGLKSRPFTFPVNPVSDVSSTALLRMLDHLRKAMFSLIAPGSFQYRPVLWHRDLHLGNIFMSPDGKISSIIDWQETAVLPLFFAARVPQFVDIDLDEILLELPSDLKEMPTAAKTQFIDRFRRSMLQQYYMATLQEKASAVIDVLTDPAHILLGQAEAFAQISYGYEHEALLLRQCLVELQRHWLEFFRDPTTAPECPVLLSDTELKLHRIDGGYYNDFKDRLAQANIPIAHDGWVHVDEFNEHQTALHQVVEHTMESLDSKAKRAEFQSRLNTWDISSRVTIMNRFPCFRYSSEKAQTPPLVACQLVAFSDSRDGWS